MAIVSANPSCSRTLSLSSVCNCRPLFWLICLVHKLCFIFFCVKLMAIVWAKTPSTRPLPLSFVFNWWGQFWLIHLLQDSMLALTQFASFSMRSANPMITPDIFKDYGKLCFYVRTTMVIVHWLSAIHVISTNTAFWKQVGQFRSHTQGM